MRRNYIMREKIFTFVLFICAGVCGSTVSNSHELPIEIPIATISDNVQGTSFAANEESDSKSGRQSDADTDHYLRVVSGLQPQSLVSGKRAQFKCKVEGHPIESLVFTWYKGNQVIHPSDDRRMSIRQKNGLSRLQINDVFTSDSGVYRCEASNGLQRVVTQSKLEVKFSLPPPPGKDEIIEDHIPSGTCELYKGDACATYLRGKFVYIDPYQKQNDVENSISAALGRISDPEIVSPSCQRYAIPALCYFVFPVCDDDDDVTRSIRGKPSAEDRSKRLCREDCELLMHDVCKDEFMNPDDDVFMEKLATETNCSLLPRTTAQGSNCMKVGLKPVVDKSHNCFNATGQSYLGTARKTVSGIPCKTWPLDLVQNYRELSGGHNFCRNPGSIEDKPWCFIDNGRKTKEICDISKCSTSTGSELITILIPSVAIPLLIGCIGAVFFICCRGNRKKNTDKGIPGKQVKCSEMQAVEMTISSAKNISSVPQLSPSCVHFTMELGDGQFGKVYKSQIMQNMQYNTNFPVAVKTLIEGAMPQQIEEFYREIEIFSEIQHPNVACLKAVVCQPNRNYMVFEYTNRVDLHEFLSLHSPHSDVGGTKVVSSASSQASSTLEQGDFMNMMAQIASGLDYLSSRNFVHRDLAARNILVCQNNVLKICNLGVVRDCYLSSYYRSPQGGHMLPIRWMAPESLTSSTFSIKTTVWSFGVLLWEMTSYGLQPYCGYSNQEVLDMITRFHLLSCPDQCASRVYALMHECWSQDPASRPTFKDIYAKLSGWEGASATRMTSQLARGIHRQLTNIMREGQHGQYSSLDSASIPSYNSNLGTPSPPPTYTSVTGNPGGYFPNTQHQFVTPAAPNVSPASHNVFNSTSPATTNSSAPMYSQGQGQRLIVDLPVSQEPSQHPHSYTQPGFLSSNAQNFGPRYYAEQQPNYAPQNARAQSQSSRSTSSCASSSREFSPVRHPNPPPNYPPRSNPGYSNNPTNDQHQYAQPGQQKFYGGIDYPQNYQPLRALSDVMEDETSLTVGNKRISQPPSAAVAPYSIGPDVENLNMSIITDSSQVSNVKTESKNTTSPKRGTDETESSTSSTSSSVQAPSCDSGLPVDEDGELLGSHVTTCQTTSLTSPLIAPKTFLKSQNFSGSRRTVAKGLNDKPSNFA